MIRQYSHSVRSSRTLHGFTLIELLVVIAIISLLVSILLPSLTKAKELAKSGGCMGNLRNLAMGFNLFAEEHDGRLPDLNPVWNPVMGNGLWYTNLLEPYTNTIDWSVPSVPGWSLNPDGSWVILDQGMWTCPAVASEDVLRCTGYGVNEHHLIRFGCDPSGNPMGSPKLEQILRSSEIFLIGDNRIYADFAGGWKTFKVIDCPVCATWEEINMGWAGAKAAAPRHPGGKEGHANAAFVDGHVESWEYEDMLNNKNDLFAHDGY